MPQNLRSHFKWLFVGASLLGACAAPEDEQQLNGEAQASQELRGDEQELRGLVATLSVDKASYAAHEAARVTITLTNTANHPVKLLKWHTPIEDVEEPIFEVKRDGEDVAYLGAHYKRPAAREADLLRLAPGESLTRTVDLTPFYDLSKTGTYTLRFAPGEHPHGAAAEKLQALRSNEVSLKIEGRQSGPVLDSGDVTTTAGTVSFSGRCSSTQQTTLLQAMSAGSAMANNSVTYLNGTPSGTPRYTTWFGAFSTNGWSQAKNQFVAIKDVFDTKPVTLDCSCKKNYYAYVYPTRPYQIYVCNAFWSAPMTGTDSKGGTLIHEISHFDVVAGTDDWVYGQSGAKNLASTDPAKALNNADNHEYFAENTPALQ